MEAVDAMDYALSLAREHREPDVDVILEREDSVSVRVSQGKVDKIEQSTEQGLGIRVVQDGRTGIAFTERLERDAVERAFLAARENAALLDPTQVVLNRELPSVPDPAALDLYNPALLDVSLEDLSALGLEIESEALGADARVKAVPYLMAMRKAAYRRIASTHGLAYEQRDNWVGAFCSVLMEQDGRRKSGGKLWLRRQWAPDDARQVGAQAVAKAAGLLDAKPIRGGKMAVVLDEDTAPGLLGMFMGNFAAESAQKGRSRLRGRLGEVIAHDSITLRDEPHRVGGGNSCYLDVEGTATAALPLIEQGRFANFLYHIESARKDGRASTGHAGRSYKGGIATRSTNLVMDTGPHDLDALCQQPERCLLVTELEGGAGCNPISGDISIGVQGYLIEGGHRVQAVDSITIAGNFYDLLLGVQGIGNAYQPNVGNRYIPPLLVDGLTVSG